MVTRVKVCCIASGDEARRAVHGGAALLGLVSAMPSGPGVIDEARIREIASGVPPGVTSVLLTSRTDPAEIVAQHDRCGTAAIQLCDRLEAGARSEVQAALPGVALIQVVHVSGPGSIDEAREASDSVDAILLDSGVPDAEIRELGGTGRTHDWATSRRIVESVDRPVFLAGGLRPDNVGEAIRAVRPYGVDVCTGLRTGGRLDDGKLVAFLGAVASV